MLIKNFVGSQLPFPFHIRLLTAQSGAPAGARPVRPH